MGSLSVEVRTEVLCGRICELEAENVKLREQSERLRTQLADVTESVGRVEERRAKTFEVGKRWMAKAARFEAENAKLSELVQYILDERYGDDWFVEKAEELGFKANY